LRKHIFNFFLKNDLPILHVRGGFSSVAGRHKLALLT
jgi:hypothetical protein